MSFSSDVKAEICLDLPAKKCCCAAVCYGILLFCNTFSHKEIKIITGNPSFAAVLPKLFRRAFGFEFDSVLKSTAGHGKQSFTISDPKKLSSIFDFYGYKIDSLVSHHVNLSVLEDECCKVSFIKGAFLAGGSVTAPEKRYHLELVTDHYSVSRETYSLLLELGFSPRDTSRKGNYIVYFKQSYVIEDLLTLMGAPVSSMKVMSAKIEKDMTNSVNRQVNCDTANIGKQLKAVRKYVDAVQFLIDSGNFEKLPEELKETAKLRIENDQLSIAELGKLTKPPISKSGMKHRLEKIYAISADIKGSDFRLLPLRKFFSGARRFSKHTEKASFYP